MEVVTGYCTPVAVKNKFTNSEIDLKQIAPLFTLRLFLVTQVKNSFLVSFELSGQKIL